jgi:ubiquinone biosynthesis protein
MSILGVHRRYEELKRYGKIVTVFIKYGFGDLLDRLGVSRIIWRRIFVREAYSSRRLSAPERLRLAFEELGPTFIKLGQLMATRPDIFASELVKELEKLQDRVHPFPAQRAVSIIEKEFKKSMGDLFSHFDEEPLAAASLAQVHRARTLDGREVVVKVQRPGVDHVIRTDTRILRELATLLERHIPESKNYEPVRLVEEFSRNIQRELDFIVEARNVERFKKHVSDDPTVYVPRVFWELTTPKVLTYEFIDGVKISDIEALDSGGFDREIIAKNGADLILKEIFEWGIFHADPHPGNLFVLQGNVIAPVDFGMVGIVDEHMADELAAILAAAVKKDADSMISALGKMGVLQGPVDRRALRLELADFLDRYHGLPLERLFLRSLTEDFMAIARRHRLRFPPEFLLMARALLMSQSLGTLLSPQFNVIEHARPYLERLMLRRMDPRRIMRDLGQMTQETLSMLRQMPSELSEILYKMSRDQLAIRFEHRGLERLIGEMDRATSRLSFAIVIAALVIGSSVIFQMDIGPKVLGYPLLGVAGYIAGSLLGIWLLWGIIRSGRI